MLQHKVTTLPVWTLGYTTCATSVNDYGATPQAFIFVLVLIFSIIFFKTVSSPETNASTHMYDLTTGNTPYYG